jgi:hypothetical protein
MTVPEPKINGCICDICADRGRECQRTAADEWTDQCLPCIRGEHAEGGMTEQEVLAYLYRKRDGALSGATRVVYAEVISAIEGDLFGDPNETPTPRRFDDRAVLCDRDAPVADHRRRTGSSDLRTAVRDRRHLAAERRSSADPLEGMPISGPVAELLLKGADDEQVEYVEALVRTFQERRRTHPSPLHSDGVQAA